jgi:hypothetical protein
VKIQLTKTRSLTLPIGKKNPEAKTAEPAPPEHQATARRVVEANLISKGLSALLVVCLVCGPAGVLLAVGSSSSAGPTVKAVRSSVDVDTPARAGDYAIRVVSSWAAATTEDSAALTELVTDSSPLSQSKTATALTNPRVASIKKTGKSWAVTVAATVGGVDRYFHVPVQAVDDSLTALALPAPVAGPQVGDTPGNDYSVTVSSSAPLTKTVTEFLAAYVAGQGDLTRYIARGVDLLPITPALGSAVELDELRAQNSDDVDLEIDPADGNRVRVLVTATITLAPSQSLQATYALTVTGSAGRWEISALDDAPAMRPSSQTPGTQPGTPPPDAPATPPLTPEEE